jgi:hypothetical protein
MLLMLNSNEELLRVNFVHSKHKTNFWFKNAFNDFLARQLTNVGKNRQEIFKIVVRAKASSRVSAAARSRVSAWAKARTNSGARVL